LGSEERRYWLTVLVIIVSKIPTYVILIHQRYRQTERTDRQTDGRTNEQTDDMQSQYRVLHYSASRGKKTKLK